MVSLLAITVSLKSVLSKLILVGTVKLRTLSGSNSKEGSKGFKSLVCGTSLQSTFSRSSFMRVQTPEYTAPIAQPIETLDQLSHSVIIWGGVEKPNPEAHV